MSKAETKIYQRHCIWCGNTFTTTDRHQIRCGGKGYCAKFVKEAKVKAKHN